MSDSPKNPAEDDPSPQIAYEAPDENRPEAAAPAATLVDYAPTPPHDPYAAFRIRNYRLYATGNICSLIGSQMMGIAISWELVSLTNSALVLGLVGLVQVIPIVGMALPAGHVIDRFDRRTVILIDQFAYTLITIGLALASIFGSRMGDNSVLSAGNHMLSSVSHWFGERNADFSNPHVPLILFLLLIQGFVRAFNGPAKESLLPQLVPPQCFNNAVTWNSSMFETSAVLGPTLAGALLWFLQLRPITAGYAYFTIYLLNTIAQLTMLMVFFPIRLRPIEHSKEKLSLRSVFAGFRFVWSQQMIFGAMSLDMFAVLLGGATALLPIYAKDILHVGPAGLGWLRAAPSLGAVSMAFLLAHMPPMKNAGRNMLLAVAGFGVATIIFGLSTSFWLSLIALFFCGVTDNVSVVVRHTLIQTLTPDAMRGRVSAVNGIFISTSNEMGAFESGTVAAAFGPAFSAVSGGIGTVAVVAIIALLSPQLRRVKSLVMH